MESLRELEASLTEKEWGMLSHRLDVPDALVECLSDYDAMTGWNPDDVEIVVELLADRQIQVAAEYAEGLTREVLAECVEGSTAICDLHHAVTDGEVTPQQAAADRRCMERLAEKIGPVVGRKLAVPYD